MGIPFIIAKPQKPKPKTSKNTQNFFGVFGFWVFLEVLGLGFWGFLISGIWTEVPQIVLIFKNTILSASALEKLEGEF